MRVLPILFSTEMVRAILDGRKTATRRVIKREKLKCLDSLYHREHPEVTDIQIINKLVEPPYQPGDILYVRENWRKCRVDILKISDDGEKTMHTGETHIGYDFEADSGIESMVFTDGFDISCIEDNCILSMNEEKRWHPSNYMPKEAARIWLKVTDVRVERLQNIGTEGMLSEGIEFCPANEKAIHDDFIKVWDSTIQKKDLSLYGWDANPWVWVIEFERTAKPDTERMEK